MRVPKRHAGTFLVAVFAATMFFTAVPAFAIFTLSTRGATGEVGQPYAPYTGTSNNVVCDYGQNYSAVLIGPGTLARRATHHPAIKQLVYAQYWVQRWDVAGNSWVNWRKSVWQRRTIRPYVKKYVGFNGQQFNLDSGYYYRVRIFYAWYKANGRRLGWKWSAFAPYDYFVIPGGWPPVIQTDSAYDSEGWAFYPLH